MLYKSDSEFINEIKGLYCSTTISNFTLDIFYDLWRNNNALFSSALPGNCLGLPVHRSASAIITLIYLCIFFSNQIPADFEFHLEVYSHILQDDLSIASTPRKIKRTIHSSISRTVGKKLAASLKDELNSGKM